MEKKQQMMQKCCLFFFYSSLHNLQEQKHKTKQFKWQNSKIKSQKDSSLQC